MVLLWELCLDVLFLNHGRTQHVDSNLCFSFLPVCRVKGLQKRRSQLVWSTSISTADRKRLNRLTEKASCVLGRSLDPLDVVGERRMLAKLSSLMVNMSHPMQDTLSALGSSFSDWLLHPLCCQTIHPTLLPVDHTYKNYGQSNIIHVRYLCLYIPTVKYLHLMCTIMTRLRLL